MWPRSPFHCPLLALLAASFFLKGTDATSCPRGWLVYQQNCYGLFYERLTWADAEEECKSYGRKGHLASILSSAERDMVAQHIAGYNKNIGSVWIGLQDSWKIRIWTWTDNSPLRFSAWTTFEPRFFTLSKYCVHLIDFRGYMEWDDVECEQPAAYLCKFPAS